MSENNYIETSMSEEIDINDPEFNKLFENIFTQNIPRSIKSKPKSNNQLPKHNVRGYQNPPLPVNTRFKLIPGFRATKTNIKNTIRNIRIFKKLTRTDIANSTGMSENYIYDMEYGNKRISFEAFIKYCSAIGIDILDILTKELDELERGESDEEK